MEKPESGVEVFFDLDGVLCWKTADGIVRRGTTTVRLTLPGSSAVDVGIGSASTICIRDGAGHLHAVAPSDGVRTEDVAASLDRIAAALDNGVTPRAEAAVPLDADGRPIELGAFDEYFVKWKKEAGGWGVDLEKTRWLFVSHSDVNSPRWWWSASDRVGEMASGYARTKAEAQRCAEAVATALGWVKP